jgi:hypothetical protein
MADKISIYQILLLVCTMYIFLFALDCLLGKLTLEYSNVQREGKKPTCFCEFDIQGGLVFEYIVGIAKFNRKKVISQ